MAELGWKGKVTSQGQCSNPDLLIQCLWLSLDTRFASYINYYQDPKMSKMSSLPSRGS